MLCVYARHTYKTLSIGSLSFIQAIIFCTQTKQKVSKLQIELKPNDVLFCSSLPKNQKYKTNTIRLPNEYEKQNKIIINL